MRSAFLQLIFEEMLFRHYAKRTIESYLRWIAAFIRFHQHQHPSVLHNAEVEAFLSDLVVVKGLLFPLKNQL